MNIGNLATERVLELAGFTREGVGSVDARAERGRVDKTPFSLLAGSTSADSRRVATLLGEIVALPTVTRAATPCRSPPDRHTALKRECRQHVRLSHISTAA